MFPKLALAPLKKTAVDIVKRACAERGQLRPEDYVRAIFREGKMNKARIKNLFGVERTATHARAV